jgi:hypothetical protein
MRADSCAFALVRCFIFTTSPVWATPLTTQQVVEGLKYFRDVWAPKDRSFTPESRRQLSEFINRQIAKARPLEKADLALICAEAASFSGNDHTLIDIYKTPGIFHPLPIAFWWFPEGAIVTSTDPQHQELLGARIISIGRVRIDARGTRSCSG